MKIKPTRDRILVKPIESDTVTKSGIVIPDSAQEKPMKGQVLGTGSGRVTNDGTVVALEVKEGDVVLFNKYAGTTFKIDNIDHIILKEDELLAIVE